MNDLPPHIANALDQLGVVVLVVRKSATTAQPWKPTKEQKEPPF